MDSLDNFLLYSHGGSANHGCEALVRSTRQIISHSASSAGIALVTESLHEDERYLGDLCNFYPLRKVNGGLDFYTAFIRYKLFGDSLALDVLPYKGLLREVDKASIAISIGGDNYCYGNPAYYGRLNELFRKKGLKTVLWGCSVDEKAVKDQITVENLKSYSLITSRESLTFDLLKSKGLNNVEIYPDPAFTLQADYSTIPFGFSDRDFVGINISPMIEKNETVPGITISNYKELVKVIIGETDLNIALIPHVVWKQSDDRIPLQQLYDEFSDSGRVIMIGDANAEQLKGVISKCRFIVAARTHASIAAYSTCVPTLVVGYSVKAKGIAKDIFGSYEDYVLPVQDLASLNDLAEKFKWLMDHENDIRNHLSAFMPGYIARAWQAGEALKKI
ncbi:MAG: polysaccharide pyruvyl transferase family protein [Bacteroidales bacterium]|nr:polysaccharide pyruvyl transferase family protein [Bacteroidales bacterium]